MVLRCSFFAEDYRVYGEISLMIQRMPEMSMIRHVDALEQFDLRPSGMAPLAIMCRTLVYHGDGRADYMVERIDAKDTATGNDVQFHVASVKDGHPGAVCVVLKKIQQKQCVGYILLGRHWRVSVSSWQWEFPRGMGEEGEDPCRTAVRELAEETGISLPVTRARVMQTIHADTGMLRDEVAVVALDCDYEDVSLQARDHELPELYWVAVPVFEEMIGIGMVQDGLTLAAWTVVRAHETFSCT